MLLANRRAEELLVVDPSLSPGRRHAVETNNLLFSAFRACMVLEGDGSGARELLMVDPLDGSDLLFEVFRLPFHAPSHPGENVIYVLRDITDLKHATLELEKQYSRSLAAEHQARRESERLNVIIENAGVPILVTDRLTQIVLMNREAEKLFDIAQGEPRSSPKTRDISANGTKLAGLINDFLLQSWIRREAQLSLVDPDRAREFPALAVSTKILNQRLEPAAVVTILHDLTQEVENEHLARELRRLNAELGERIASATHELAKRNALLEAQRTDLERASRMKSEFLATMSHELRTPLNAVLGYLSLMRRGLFGPMSPKQEHALKKTRAAAEHLLSLINDILDLSTVEAGKIRLQPSEIELAAFVGSLSETVEPMATAKSLDYRVQLEEGVTLRADAMRLRQVLLNLLTNAVKFTDSGSVTLRVRRSCQGASLRMEVIDTGLGIHQEHLETIFEEFRQLDQSMTRQHGGTGLGLAISRKLIALMGGSLTVESALGRGSTFRVELPVKPAAASSVPEPQPPEAARPPSSAPADIQKGGVQALSAQSQSR
jgi:signal transduction histidine kinase